MGLVILIVTACLSGDLCRDSQIPLDAEITQGMCVRQGQIGLAQWAAGHPAYTIRRWRCEVAGVTGAT